MITTATLLRAAGFYQQHYSRNSVLTLIDYLCSTTLANAQTATAKLVIGSGILIISRHRIPDSPLKEEASPNRALALIFSVTLNKKACWLAF